MIKSIALYMNYLLIFCIILLNLIILSECNVKTWNANIDYNNANNWDQQRNPCSNDRIIFAENSVIYLNQEIKAKEIILPKNGQIVFGEKASISLVEDYDQNQCNGKDIKFMPKQDNDWFDPYNWNQTIDVFLSNQLISENKFIGSSEDQNPVPHMERIPCAYDSVYFSSNTTFKVRIDSDTKIVVKSLKIWEKAYNSDEFKRLVISDVGKQLFSIKNFDDKFVINEDMVCTDNKGCVCGNEEPEIMAKVCDSVTQYGCPSLQCSDPIRPVGHCCDVCASMLTISFKNDFSLELIQGISTEFMRNVDYSSVGSYLHKLKSQKFQFIAIDLADKGLANKMVNAIKQYLYDDTKLGPGLLSIDSVKIESSTQWKSSSGGLWITFILVLLVLIGSVVAVNYYMKKRRFTAHFAFARFHSSDNEDGVELRMGTTPHEALDPNLPAEMSTSTVRTDGQSYEEAVTFENPIFSKQELKDRESECQQKSTNLTSIENPFFSTES